MRNPRFCKNNRKGAICCAVYGDYIASGFPNCNYLKSGNSNTGAKGTEKMIGARKGGGLTFQEVALVGLFEDGHLLNGNLIEFLQALGLGHAFVDKDRIQVLHVA